MHSSLPYSGKAFWRDAPPLPTRTWHQLFTGKAAQYQHANSLASSSLSCYNEITPFFILCKRHPLLVTRRKPADLFSVCYRSASKYAADLQMIRRFSADHLQNICRMSAECLQNICRMSANCLNLQNICSLDPHAVL